MTFLHSAICWREEGTTLSQYYTPNNYQSLTLHHGQLLDQDASFKKSAQLLEVWQSLGLSQTLNPKPVLHFLVWQACRYLYQQGCMLEWNLDCAQNQEKRPHLLWCQGICGTIRVQPCCTLIQDHLSSSLPVDLHFTITWLALAQTETENDHL